MDTAEKTYTEREAHRKFAAEFFNGVWTLLEKEVRTPAEDDQMLHGAHASRYHWSFVGDASNLGIGEWQVSRVYSVLGRPEPAAYHARRYLELATVHGLGPFHVGFAHEALARAAAVAGDASACEAHLRQAREQGAQVEDEEERNLLFADLGTVMPGT